MLPSKVIRSTAKKWSFLPLVFELKFTPLVPNNCSQSEWIELQVTIHHADPTILGLSLSSFLFFIGSVGFYVHGRQRRGDMLSSHGVWVVTRPRGLHVISQCRSTDRLLSEIPTGLFLAVFFQWLWGRHERKKNPDSSISPSGFQCHSKGYQPR